MQQQFDTLQQQLQTVQQFEILFKSKNLQKFKEHLGTVDLENTFRHFMKDHAEAKAELVFGTSDLGPNSDAIRLLEAVQGSVYPANSPIKSRTNPGLRALTFTNLVIDAIQQFDGKKNEENQFTSTKDLHIQKLRRQTIAFVEAQKLAITQALQNVSAAMQVEETRVKTEQANREKEIQDDPDFIAAEKIASEYSSKIAEARLQQEATAQFRKKFARYAGVATLATAGLSALTFSTLMQFSPQFVTLVGFNLPPVALAAVAISGMVVLAASVYAAYRTNQPAASGVTIADLMNRLPAVDYTKAITPAFLASGLGLTGFSALQQFSPKFALFMGLNLPAPALIAIAAIGVLLLSIGLYRACKAYAQSRPHTPTLEATDPDANVQTPPTCMQRLSKYTECCFKIFSRSGAAASTAQDPKAENEETNIDAVTL